MTAALQRPLVLLLDSAYPDLSAEREAVESAGAEFRVGGSAITDEDATLALDGVADAAVLLVELAPVTARVLDAARSCRAVIRYGTGVDNIDVDRASELGIAVHSVPDYASDSVADHTMALVLAATRRIVDAHKVVRDGGWRGDPGIARPIGLRGRTIGFIGAGHIARAVAARAQAFGLRCIAHDPFVSAGELAALGVEHRSLDEVLGAADIVSVHAPLTPSTRHLISAATLASMRPGTILVNTSRGGLIDERAALAALDAGRLGHLLLDVTDPEPPAVDSTLRAHPRVILTPHIGFWSDTSERALRSAVLDRTLEVLASTPAPAN